MTSSTSGSADDHGEDEAASPGTAGRRQVGAETVETAEHVADLGLAALAHAPQDHEVQAGAQGHGQDAERDDAQDERDEGRHDQCAPVLREDRPRVLENPADIHADPPCVVCAASPAAARATRVALSPAPGLRSLADADSLSPGVPAASQAPAGATSAPSSSAAQVARQRHAEELVVVAQQAELAELARAGRGSRASSSWSMPASSKAGLALVEGGRLGDLVAVRRGPRGSTRWQRRQPTRQWCQAGSIHGGNGRSLSLCSVRQSSPCSRKRSSPMAPVGTGAPAGLARLAARERARPGPGVGRRARGRRRRRRARTKLP